MSQAEKGTNRLAGESSPYLRLHAHNPVDWYPWGPEAIEKARREDKPIFLSVGYSTCYWCHVMERESFSNAEIAAEMNAAFVNVKLDREERPDLDEIYMLATQILAGQGGWPNSVFLTPKLEPFFAGTYFPPEERYGRPGFPTVVRSMQHAWSERREDVESQATELAGAIRRHLDEAAPWQGELPGGEVAEQALAVLRKRFDGTWGGFGEAPKFPTPSNLWLLAELSAAKPAAAMMLEATLDAMARGGIFDHLAGGFHRYATDREWRVPHFEKMLYDNGLLLECYAREHERSGSPEAARIALATAEFLANEMTDPGGALWSAIDAETDGHEGAYYVWTRDELDAALGPEDAQFLAPILGFDGEPFFEKERYVLHLPRPVDVLARERRTKPAGLLGEIAPLRARLLAARSARKRPATDDKVLADWNGTAVAGLAVAGRVLGRPELVERAARAADFVLASLRTSDGTLLHAWRGGRGAVPAFLSDYAYFVRGLLALHEASGDRRWLDEAVRLADEMESRLASPAGGYFNAAAGEDLLVRGKEIFDGAMPAANAVAALDLLALAAATGETRFHERLERSLRAFAPVATTHVDGARAFSIALARAAETRGGPAASEVAGGGASRAESPLERQAGEQVRALLRTEAAGEGDWAPFELRLSVARGWHLTPLGDASGAALVLAAEGAELADIEVPRPVGLPLEGSPRGLEGEVVVSGRWRAPGKAGPGSKLRVRYQVCGDGRCLPETAIELDLGG